MDTDFKNRTKRFKKDRVRSDCFWNDSASFPIHNEYLQYATFGIPKALAYTCACIGVFVRNLKNKQILKEGSFVCLTAAFTYLVSACFEIAMYNAAPLLYIFLGLGY